MKRFRPFDLVGLLSGVPAYSAIGISGKFRTPSRGYDVILSVALGPPPTCDDERSAGVVVVSDDGLALIMMLTIRGVDRCESKWIKFKEVEILRYC